MTIRLCLGASLLGTAITAHATILCVPTDATLPAAVQQANNGPEGSVWDIRLRSGTYQLNSNLLFIPDGDKDNKAFFLTGGWGGAGGQCITQSLDPSSTIVRGVASTANSFGTKYLFLGDNARYEIRSIRFEDFYDFNVDDKICYGFDICPDTDKIKITNNEFINGERVGVTAYDARQVVFSNNLVAKIHPIHYNSGDIDQAPVGINLKNSEDQPQVTFNTFANIDCAATPGGVMIHSSHPNLALHHNIFQTTGCLNDVFLDPTYSGQPIQPWSNLFLSLGGISTGNLVSQGNVINFNPMFVNAASGNYHLQNASPAVNSGQTLIGAIQKAFSVNYVDLDGLPRPVGSRFDIGAFESLVNDGAPSSITVTNTNDTTDINSPQYPGSLRAAINQANSQNGTAQRIAFNIPGGCPRVILLNAELPDITDSLFIDGYSQPGAVPNDLDLGSDASICVLIGPAVGGISHALQVPTGQPDTTQLTVDGLEFGSGFAAFSAVAIALRAGSGHIIRGSAFGGTAPGDGSSLGSLERAILIRGSATDVKIGGAENRARNYMGAMNNNAIVITDSTTSGHLIQNNYIGITPNGLSVQPNALDGINATGGSFVTIADNTIAASARGIQLSGSSTKNFTIVRNRIGVNAAGVGVAAQANEVGIEVGGGSSEHVIGFAANENIQTGTFSNDVRNNNSAGVRLTTMAGSSISLRGNHIDANGRSGSGLGLDLGLIGQLPNDAGDIDDGPNLGQNYPVIVGSQANGSTRSVTAVLNTNANQIVRVDIYRSPTCRRGETGANGTVLVGSLDVQTGPTGIVNFVAQTSSAGAPGYVTATATTVSGNSSELAPCFSEDTIFAQGFQGPGL